MINTTIQRPCNESIIEKIDDQLKLKIFFEMKRRIRFEALSITPSIDLAKFPLRNLV
jgi:hypothetical protein